MNRDVLARVVLDGRHTGELLAHPCNCPSPSCMTLGEHLWDSTRNMAPGPRAQAFEPRTITPTTGPNDHDTPPDPTTGLHLTYRELIENYQQISLDLAKFIGRYRPDRWTPLPDPFSDDQWCRNHLAAIGLCEPRHRGDLCRWCYDTGLVHGQAPDAELMRARRDRGWTHPKDMTEFAQRITADRPKKHKRKRAS